jgi:hypothetical protein
MIDPIEIVMANKTDQFFRQAGTPKIRMKKILIFHQGALGDLVTLFPLLVRLRDEYPVIDIICQNKIGGLVRHLGLVDNAFPQEAAVFASLFTEDPLPEQLAMLNTYDTILLFSNADMLFHRIRGCATGQIHRIAPRPSPDQNIHISDYVLARLNALSVIPVNENVTADAMHGSFYTDWRHSGFDPELIVIHPGSGSPLKNWPLPHFLACADHLRGIGLKPIFLLGPAEEKETEKLTQQSVRFRQITDLVALVEVLRTAGGFIGNDSGVTHLAAFLGLATIGIFGPSDPIRWHPRGRTTAIISDNGACEPCFEKKIKLCRKADCLMRITPMSVLNMFFSLSRG